MKAIAATNRESVRGWSSMDISIREGNACEVRKENTAYRDKIFSETRNTNLVADRECLSIQVRWSKG